jgi:hypothetical protein
LQIFVVFSWKIRQFVQYGQGREKVNFQFNILRKLAKNILGIGGCWKIEEKIFRINIWKQNQDIFQQFSDFFQLIRFGHSRFGSYSIGRNSFGRMLQLAEYYWPKTSIGRRHDWLNGTIGRKLLSHTTKN